MFHDYYWFLVNLMALFVIIVSSEKINERRILLPYNSGVPTNFTLETYGDTSCYKWSSSRPDIVSVKQLLNDVQPSTSPSEHRITSDYSKPTNIDDVQSSCSRRAMVTVVSTLPKRQSTVITAYDLKTNLQIRCDVEIDVIDKITIQTTTKEIVYGEQPESIKAYAYSSKNDMFTSIGGVQFDWILTPSDILRYRSWSSSPYASPDYVEYWESRGAKSANILVEGVKTGSARIRATILGQAYRNVEPAEIKIHVVANLLLIPSNDVFLVLGARVQFRAEISKQGPRQPLNLPNQQYFLEVNDPQVAIFNDETNMLEALQEGHTSLILRDRNMISMDGLSLTSNDTSELLFSRTRTDIHVQQPGYISMTVQPGDSSFQLCENFQYELHLTLHDDWHHALYPSDNLEFELKFDPEYFEVLHSSMNKTFYLIRTLKLGRTKLTAEFNGAGSYRLNEPLANSQDVSIHPKITLQPNEIYLPYIRLESDNQMVDIYEVNVNAIGATGDGYNWQSNNETLATVKYSTQKSQYATIYRKALPGQVAITCTDVHNSFIFNAIMMINVLPIDAVQVLPSVVEAEVGSSVLLPIAVMAFKADSNLQNKFYFDDCSKVHFQVDIIQKNRIRYVKDMFMPGIGKHSCRSLSFECLASGDSRVTISYQASFDRTIFTHANIGCHQPLKSIHPNEQKDTTILALGAGIDLAFEGGPRPWSMYPKGHYSKITASNSSIVELKEIRDRYRYNKDLHVFRAYCRQYGQTNIDLNVGNIESATLPKPAMSSTTVSIICSPPETLIIKPKTKSTCPQQEQQFTMENNRDVELEIQVLDQHGRVFYNVSTLYFEWSKDVSVGMFEETSSVREEINGAQGFQILTRSYQILSGLTAKRIGVRCRITGYHQHRLYNDQLNIRKEIEMILTDPLVTNENSITILKHPDYQKQIEISHGSGYFSIDWSGKQAIQIDIVTDDKRKFLVKAVTSGSGIISIRDLCLDYSPYTLPFSVVEPIDIKVQLVDKIQLGHKVDGLFYVLDNRGNRLHSSLHKYLDFAIIASNNFLLISEITPKSEYLSKFTIKAERLGHCKLTIQSQSSKIRTIQSTQLDVQIFSPLQISPSNITLIVGNVFQPSFLGGPQTRRNVEFMIEDQTIASTLNPNGLIQAMKIGRTKLIAKVISVNNYEYSRAQANIFVTPLRKVKIWIPINQVLVGSSIPIYLIGDSDQNETPFMFGHAEPPLKITWTLSNDKIGTLQGSFQSNAIMDDVTDQISARFLAKTIGTVALNVTVEVTSISKDPLLEQLHRNRPISDTVQIQVHSNYLLAVSSPAEINIAHNDVLANGLSDTRFPLRSLLMSPQSELMILNQNQLDSITYRIPNVSTQIRLVNQTGNLLIQTGDRLEFSSLMISRDLMDRTSGIHQYFSVAIHVDKVRYLQLEFDFLRHSNNVPDASVYGNLINLYSFPIGSEIKLVAHYFDQLGRRFDAVKSNLKWILSRNDIITVTGSSDSPQSILIRSLANGQVVLAIWDDVNQVRQFYKIIVQTIIEPSTNAEHQTLIINMGDVVCMRTKMETDVKSVSHVTSSQGLWYVDQDLQTPIAWIHEKTGLLIGLNPGKASIIYNHSMAMISTYKLINVQPLTRIMLNTDSILGISTTWPISIPLILSADKPQHIKLSSSYCPSNPNDLHEFHKQKPFDCDAVLSVKGVAELSLWEFSIQYNWLINQWSCLLTPKSGLDIEALAKWNDNNMDRNVTITVFSHDASLQMSANRHSNPIGFLHQVQLPFWPAFHLSLKQIILTSDSNEALFSVYSSKTVLDDLIITCSNEVILSAQKVIESQSKETDFQFDESMESNPNSIKILVSLKSADIFSNDLSNLHLLLTSKLINQTVRIPVQIKLYASHWFAGGSNQVKTRSMQQMLLFTTGSVAGSQFYYLSTVLITLIIAFSIYALIKRMLLDQQKIVYVHDTPNTPSSSTYQQQSSSVKSPRIIDYHNQTNITPTRKLGLSHTKNLFFDVSTPVSTSGHRTIGSSGGDSSQVPSPTSRSPRVGRPLYSTRSFT